MPPRTQRRLLQAPAGEDVLVAAAMQRTVVEHVRSSSPLLPALLRGAQAKRQLFEAEGGTLSAVEVARLLQRSRPVVRAARAYGEHGAAWSGPTPRATPRPAHTPLVVRSARGPWIRLHACDPIRSIRA